VHVSTCSTTTENHSDEEWDDAESVTNGAALKTSDQAGGTLVRALYDYVAKEEDELSFKAGLLCSLFTWPVYSKLFHFGKGYNVPCCQQL
jgi:SH3 domain